MRNPGHYWNHTVEWVSPASTKTKEKTLTSTPLGIVVCFATKNPDTPDQEATIITCEKSKACVYHKLSQNIMIILFYFKNTTSLFALCSRGRRAKHHTSAILFVHHVLPPSTKSAHQPHHWYQRLLFPPSLDSDCDWMDARFVHSHTHLVLLHTRTWRKNPLSHFIVYSYQSLKWKFQVFPRHHQTRMPSLLLKCAVLNIKHHDDKRMITKSTGGVSRNIPYQPRNPVVFIEEVPDRQNLSHT